MTVHAPSRRTVLSLPLLTAVVSSCRRRGPAGGRGSRLDVPFRFGAYVDPPLYLEDDRIAAFEGFERALGRRLDIYHSYHPWEESFPSVADRYFARRGTQLLLSWGGTDTAVIQSGAYDDLIARRARALRALDTPVLLQWRWEMNRPNLAAEIRSGADYVAAWRRIRDIFTEVRVPRVQWAWCPLVDDGADLDFTAYFPGVDYVDFVGANGYAREADESFEDVFAPFFRWARDLDHPVLIGEFGRSATMGDEETQARWLAEAGRFLVDEPTVEAVCYFNNARGASGDYDITGSPAALDALRGWEQ